MAHRDLKAENVLVSADLQFVFIFLQNIFFIY